ncbi:TetR/AcrR family transcriptional regulator [Gordonia sp. DT30]|uniref:TetR/AcrR family transcriptional regulator n=1 Tax=Gordonia sp. DT30 TaxID=3416546 RepID=UPI003CF1105A
MGRETGTSSTPRSRTERQRARNRGKLVSAAAELLATAGPEGLTVTAVTERADLGTGTFYNYFQTREEITAAVVHDALESLGARLDLLTEPMTDPAEINSCAMRHMVTSAVGDPLWGWLLVRLGIGQQELRNTIGPLHRRDVRKGVEAGRFSIPDATVATAIYFGGLLATIQAKLSGDGSDNPDSVFAEYMLRAFGLSDEEAHEIAFRPLPPLPELPD